jgi:Tfp pilus assembly protein PilX
MRRLLARVRHEEDGWVLATAMVLMAIMLPIGLASLNYIDTQQRESGAGRTRETAFNVAEAALNAQIFALTKEWPGVGKAAQPYTACNQASATSRCPNPTTLKSLFTSPDVATGLTWSTSVRDNNTGSTQNFYSDTLTATSPGYDANGDGRLWVRAQATARGRTRTIVSLVRVEEIQEALPRGAVISGKLSIDNNGNKVMIDATVGAYPAVTVRCSKIVGICVGHGWVGSLLTGALGGKFTAQVSPPTYVDNYAGGDAATAEAQLRMKNTAIANGTYYATCPSTVPSGAIVWIESGNCHFTGNGGGNTAASPGLLIINNGTLYFGGTTYFYGVVYAINPTDSSGTIVDLQGNTEITGGVLVDGPGNLSVGSSKLNIKLFPTAWDSIRSYGSAGIIQNTWREIRSGQ